MCKGAFVPMNKKERKTILPALFFYPLAIVYFELFLKFADRYNNPLNITLLPTILFSLGTGFLMTFFFLLLRPTLLSRILSGILITVLWIFFCVELDCNIFYNMYYGLIYSVSMTGQVMGDFSSVVFSTAIKYIPLELGMALPVILHFVFLPKIIPSLRKFHKQSLYALIPALMFLAGAEIFSRLGPNAAVFTHDFTVQSSVPSVGLLTTTRLELTYFFTGIPEEKTEDVEYTLWTAENENPADTIQTTPETGKSEKPGKTESDKETGKTEPVPEIPKEYEYNAAVDFGTLIENEPNANIKNMHEFFGSLEPTKQNEYTGYFEGKNLIFLSAEAFCPYAIDKEYTPTLYKLANNGFVFTNYYQPDWTLSTTGGEFANMTGLLPQWINASNSFIESQYVSMTYAPGHMFANAGYVCRAYHNNSYTYYERDKTHTNLGYDYKGLGNGLVLEHIYWPNSDLEMMKATVDEMTNDYRMNHKPFHTYYMTISGHCHYNWGGNAMSAKNRESAVAAFPDASQTVQAYKACNKELDLALEYLLAELEEKGLAKDTVICLSADHYPYSMTQGGTDYYKELSGIDDTPRSVTRFQNTLILYCASMKEPVIVDTPCSSIDIVPTLNNLFGIEYDSRLYSGRDILAEYPDPVKVSYTMPLVILPVSGTNGNSFITPAGTFDYLTGEFTPNEGITVPEDYVSNVSAIIRDKWKYAKLMITSNYYGSITPGG